MAISLRSKTAALFCFVAAAPVLVFAATMRIISQVNGPQGRLTKIINYGTLTADPLISDAAFPFLCLVCAGIGLFAAFIAIGFSGNWGSTTKQKIILCLSAGLVGLLFGIERIHSAFFGTVHHGYPLPKDVLFEPFVLSFGMALLIPSLLFLAGGANLWFRSRQNLSKQ